MNRNELIQARQHFISAFQTFTREDKLKFLNFNRYHHKRPIQDILSIFIQAPDARYLGSFEFWKNYSTESSVQFGEKAAVRLYDKEGRLSETLFDITQTTLHTVPEIRDTILSDCLLTNSLAELTNNDYFIGEEHYGQYFEKLSDYIEQYIKEHVPATALESYSPKQQKLALTLAKYNICEEFGAFLEDSKRYKAFLDHIGTSIDEMGPEDNLLRTLALGNNYSKELSTQVYSLYEEVDKKTAYFIQEQASLNNKIASLNSDLAFDEPDVSDISEVQKELTGTEGKATIQIKWNETTDNDNFKFLNQSHEGEEISLEMLKAMIDDEVQLENNPEIGYYKVKTTFNRIDIGDGFESNQELYQDIARTNHLEIDVQTYYDSIVPEKDDEHSTQEKHKTWKSDKEKSNRDYTNENNSKSESEDLTLLSDDELLDGLRESYNTMIGKNGNLSRKGAFTRWAELRSEESRRRTEAEKNNSEILLFDVLEDIPSHTESKDDSPIITEEEIVEVVPQNNQDKVNFIFPEENIYPKTPREKVDVNIEAIQLVKKLDEEKRLATPFEQHVLARYVGWGGLANKFFDESNPVFEEQRNTLKKLVSLAEYSAMRESSLTAYYTDPQLIQKMYASLENLGFTGGKILDPSMGTGNFFSALPEALQDNSELYGVELDKITGQIAKQLHQATNIQVTGFEHTKFVNDALDLVITNVPFGQIPIVDKRYEKNHVIHDYFIKRSLDLVHEGGFVAVITSTATMDKQDDRVRSELARQANLITAARLPKNAFTAIAGTDVSSDILIFQKTSTPDPSPEWLETTSLSDGRGNTVHYNKYFENHPDHILGHIKIEAFNGGTLSITPEFSLDDLPMELGKVLSDTQVEIKPFEKKDKTLQVLEEIKLPGQTEDFNIEPYTIEVIEGVPYYHNGEEVVRHQKTSSITLNANETRQNQLNRFEKVKDRIFDKKTSYKNIFSGSGYFDSWSNFIFTPAKENTPKIPHEVLEMLNDGYDQTIHEDHRYTVSKGKDNLLTLTVEEAISTKYSYTQDYNSREVKAMQGMIDLRHSLQDVLNIQRLHDISEPEYKVEYETLLRCLNDKYDTFVKKYGAVSRPENATLLRRDDYYPFLTSIEQEKENSITHEKEYSKAHVFFEPTIQPLPQSVVVSSAGDALLASLNHKGKLDFEYMTDVYEGHTREDIIQELGNQIFYEGNGQYATREEYLSGDVKTKLSLAKTNNDFGVEGYDWSVNIQALEEVIPLDLPLSDINYRLGARFIPIPVYQRFLAEQFEQKGYYDDDYNADWITIEYDERGDSYKVAARMEGTYGLRDKFGLASKNYPGDKLATELLNLRDPKIYKPDPNDPTGKKRVLDEVATEAIQDKGKMLTSAFKDWVLKTPDVQMEIVQIYNEKFNRYVGRTYDGSQLTVNGLAKQFKLRPHQANAVMRVVIEGRVGLAHEVGAGKTLTLLASARKMKELDIVQKPLFVIPKPLVEQFGREIYQYFPESHVLIAQSEDFQKENRKRFVSRILTGKYDFIVIADSQFGKIAMSKEYQEHYILTQLEAERSAMENMKDKSFTGLMSNN